jgi:hypothetical protein
MWLNKGDRLNLNKRLKYSIEEEGDVTVKAELILWPEDQQ